MLGHWVNGVGRRLWGCRWMGGGGLAFIVGGCYISCGGILRVCGSAAFRIVSHRIGGFALDVVFNK